MQATSPVRDGTVVASQLTHQPNSDRQLLKAFSPDFFLCGYCGVFFELANGYDLLRFFDDILQLTLTIYKRRTLRTARRLPSTNVWQSCLRDNLSLKFLMQVHFSWQPVDSYRAKKSLLFATLLRVNFFLHKISLNERSQ